MKIHHLNCGTMCPVAGRLINAQRKMVCHCLLIEVGNRLVLVDTGYGRHDVQTRGAALGAPFRALTGPRLELGETALSQVEQRGFRASDVSDILVTHLDLDHASGIGDFPAARVHVHKDEHAAAMARATFAEKNRYKPSQWAHGPNWNCLETSHGESWKGVPCVKSIPGLPPEILLIALPGHSRGHSGIAVETPNGWLVHCGDAYFHKDEMHPESPSCPTTLRVFQKFMAVNDSLRRENQERLRLLAKQDSSVRLFSAHDPDELASLQSA